MGLRNGGQEIGGRTGLDNRRRASAFDPLNPPGGPPVAAWLASSLSPGPAAVGSWASSIGNAYFGGLDAGDDVARCVTVGGKNRVRFPYSGSGVGVKSQAMVSNDPNPSTPFSVPSGTCSIVLVSASLGTPDVGDGGRVLSNGQGSLGATAGSWMAPSRDDVGVVGVGGSVVSNSVDFSVSPHVYVLNKASDVEPWVYYRDGEDNTGENVTNEWGDLWIGDTGSSAQYFPNDDIVAILIFDRVLSPAEITSYTTWGIAEAGA